MDKKFAIVKFTKENDDVGVIPCCWILEDRKNCYYPNVTSDNRRDKLLKGGEMPDPSWPIYEISIMKSYATYREAREKLKKAAETSDLESDREEKRKRKKREILLPGEPSDDETHQKKKSCLTNNRSHSHPYPSPDSFSNPSSSSSSSMLLQPLQDITDQLNTDHPSSNSKSSPAHHVMLPPSPPSRSTSSPARHLMLPHSPSSRSTSSPVNRMLSHSPSSRSTSSSAHQVMVSPSHSSRSTSSAQHAMLPPSSSSRSSSSPAHHVTLPPSLGSGHLWVNSSPPHHSSMDIRGTSVSLDATNVEKLWSALNSLTATVASQSEEMTVLHQKIDQLLARGPSTGTNQLHEDDTQLLNSFPLSSIEEFDQFEDKLKEPEFRSLVVKLLASLGGKEPKLLMFNAMKRCLSSELGMKFSFTGKPSKDQYKEKKRAFVSTVLCSTIQSAIRRIYPRTSEEQIKTHIGHWLQQSKNRAQSPRVMRARGVEGEEDNSIN